MPTRSRRTRTTLGHLPTANVTSFRRVIPAMRAAAIEQQRYRNRFRRGGGLAGLGIRVVDEGRRIWPGPMPVWGGNPRICNPSGPMPMTASRWDTTSCRWVPGGISTPAPPVTVGSGPVPSGFPTNQIFVNSDGSQWIYSAAQKKWLNVGIPYNVGAGATSAPPPSTTTTSTGITPVSSPSVNVAAPAPPAAAASTYQPILDWMSQSSLISSVPNWIVAFGGALLLKKFSGEGARR